MVQLPKGQRTGRRLGSVRTGGDRLFDLLAVSHQTDGRLARSERLQVADLRAARDQHPGPREEQPEARTRKHKRQKTNKKVKLQVCMDNVFALRFSRRRLKDAELFSTLTRV